MPASVELLIDAGKDPADDLPTGSRDAGRAP